jgi:glutamyl-tRNA synthetase
MKDKQVRVRFAPSPTGPLHIGGIRTALYNYLFARKNKGVMVLRIEDTDQNRYVPGTEEYIMESIEWCGIRFDEGVKEGGPYGPYRQSERKSLYEQYVMKLIEKGHAYYAFDTAEELEQMRKRQEAGGFKLTGYNQQSRLEMKNSLTLDKEDVQQRINNHEKYVIRIRIPENEEIKVFDEVRNWVNVDSSTMDDKVLFKSDGMPTYHLANVVDDHMMKITNVIRGEEWLPSLPLHALLYKYLGWENEMPDFAHLPLLLKPDGKGKLSKRDGDRLGFPVFPLQWKDPKTGELYSGFRESGYFPEAFVNILVFLGWNPGTEQELFTMEELIDVFTLERVGKSGSRFDPKKAKWFNHQYLIRKSNAELATQYEKILKKKKIEISVAYVEKIVGLIKERANFVSDFWEQSKFFFIAPEDYEEKLVRKRWKENTPDILRDISAMLMDSSDFSRDSIEKTVKDYIEEKELGMGQVMIALRLCIVGSGMGPDLFAIMELLGKKEVIQRVKRGIENIGG